MYLITLNFLYLFLLLLVAFSTKSPLKRHFQNLTPNLRSEIIHQTTTKIYTYNDHILYLKGIVL